MLSRYLVFISLLAATGCGNSGKATVHGQLKYADGTPVTGMANSQIVFEPQDVDARNVSAAGTLDAEGKFTLATDGKNDGAPVGKNKVLIAPYQKNSLKPAPRVVLEKYESFETSGIVLDVVPGTNDFTITVEPFKK